MPRLRLFFMLALALFLVSVLAQEAQQRIIHIDFSGGSQRSENLRYGPLVYTHPEPEGIVATVSNLTIYAQNAELRAPEGVLIAQAEGQREATFVNGVRVERGRLEALGPELVYSEATGIGEMAGPIEISIAPREEGDDPVQITAETASFDVDEAISTSRGNVNLVSGRSTAEAQETVFAEEQDLAVLSGAGQQVRIVRVNDEGDEVVITADEARVLTEDDRLLATGNVTLLSGNTRSTGDTVFFDDTTSRAEILGSPAVSVNEVENVRISGPAIEHLTDIDVVELLPASAASQFDTEQFLLERER